MENLIISAEDYKEYSTFYEIHLSDISKTDIQDNDYQVTIFDKITNDRYKLGKFELTNGNIIFENNDEVTLYGIPFPIMIVLSNWIKDNLYKE